MAYATIDDIKGRITRTLSSDEETVCTNLLEDVAVIIDAYNVNASADAKKVVSCNAVIRAIGKPLNALDVLAVSSRARIQLKTTMISKKPTEVPIPLASELRNDKP
mgnify:CR=1 FL=1